MAAPQERILIIKHGALGDFVLAVGAMKALRERHPNSHITLMTMAMFAPMARQLNIIDDILIDNRVPYRHLRENYDALKAILDGRFDIIYDLQGSSRTRKRYYPIVRLFTRRDLDWVDVPSGERRHLSARKGPFPATVTATPFAIDWPISDLSGIRGEGKYFHELPDRYVLLIPGCAPQHPHKRWPIASYRELVKRLADLGIPTVILGTKSEAQECEAIASASPLALNFMGKTTLSDIPQLACRAIACIGNDTGPTHICSYSGSPVLAIFPYKTRKSAIRAKKTTNLISDAEIDRISVDTVWENLTPYLPHSTTTS